MNKATVIIGFEGSGKTAKAVQMAKKIGTYIFVDYKSLKSRFELGTHLAQLPDCVIVEEATLELLENDTVKSLITPNEIMIERKYQDPEIVKAPKKWIFTVCLNSRRFELEVV